MLLKKKLYKKKKCFIKKVKKEMLYAFIPYNIKSSLKRFGFD